MWFQQQVGVNKLTINQLDTSFKCVPCPMGYYCPVSALTSPIKCPDAQITNVTGMSACMSCARGWYALDQGTTCVDCRISVAAVQSLSSCIGVWFAVTLIPSSVVLALILITCLLICLVGYYRHYKRSKQNEKSELERILLNENAQSIFEKDRPQIQIDSTMFEVSFEGIQLLIIMQLDFTDLTEIGRGSSGAVCLKGMWHKQLVAIKVYNVDFLGYGQERFKEFENELTLLAYVTSY